MRIFIPTRGRIDRQITYDAWYLHKCHVTIVYPRCERDAWELRADDMNADFLEVPDEYNFSDIRQFILEQDGDRHLVLDDDLLLYHRYKGSKKLFKADFLDAVMLLNTLDHFMDKGYVHGGVGFRMFNNQYEDHELERENMVCTCAHFYRADVLRAESLRFDDIPGKQDLHGTLSLLELGYPNIVTNEWVHLQECGKPGGCSRYRDDEFISFTSRRLQELHPEVVTLRKKGNVVETRIAWKKAFCLKEHLRKWNT